MEKGYQLGYPGQPQPGYETGYPGQPQPGYPQTQAYIPPPAFTSQSPQLTGAAVVVTQQPATECPRSPIFGRTKNFYLTESTLMTLLLCAFGGCPALCCTVPAILFSLSAQKAHAAGNTAVAISKANTAHQLIIAALVYAVVGYVSYIVISIIVAPVGVIVSAAASSSYNG